MKKHILLLMTCCFITGTMVAVPAQPSSAKTHSKIQNIIAHTQAGAKIGSGVALAAFAMACGWFAKGVRNHREYGKSLFGAGIFGIKQEALAYMALGVGGGSMILGGALLHSGLQEWHELNEPKKQPDVA